MVNHTALQNSSSKYEEKYEEKFPHLSSGNSTIQCKFQNSSSHENPDGPFIWDKSIQELILSSYFYGYITSQVFIFIFEIEIVKLIYFE
jgi:hypothetical protein